MISNLSFRKIEFTEQEVKDFIAKHPTEKIDDVEFVKANDETKTLKDHILLIFYQNALLFANDASQQRSNMNISFNYLNKLHPQLVENIPNLKEHIDKELGEYNKKYEEVVFVQSYKFSQLTTQTTREYTSCLKPA